MRNKGIFQGHPAKRKAGKRTKGTEHTTKDHRKPRAFATNRHHHRHKERATTEAPAILKIKYILNFAVFGLRNSRENTNGHQIKSNFCPVSDAFCPDDRQERERPEDKRGCLLYMGAQNKGHPPLLPERQTPSTPIIFRTKNTEKSRLGLIGKNFGKNLWENVSG